MGGARHHEADEKRGQRTAGRRPAPAATDKADRVLELQRAIGNRGVVRALVQRKLEVGPAGDAFEREADRMADDVMRALAAPTTTGHDRTPVRRSTVDGAVGVEGGALGADAETAINGARGGGSRLPDALRTSMEGSFGADFSGVRVHAGPSADDLNRSMQARAFTVGSDIFFARDQYRPGTTAGQRLLAHELAHTLQQGTSPSVSD